MRIKLGSELKHVYINNSKLYVLYTQLLELMIHHDMQPEPIFGVGKVMRVHIYVRTYAWPRNETQPAGFFVRKNTRTLVGHCLKNGEYDNVLLCGPYICCAVQEIFDANMPKPPSQDQRRRQEAAQLGLFDSTSDGDMGMFFVCRDMRPSRAAERQCVPAA